MKRRFKPVFLIEKRTKKIPQETKRGWKTIIINNNIKSFDLGDRSSNTIAQIRQRLFISGDLSKDSKSALYDRTGCGYFEI
jgi:hypothetical protein